MGESSSSVRATHYDLRSKSFPEFLRLLPFEVLYSGIILKNEEEPTIRLNKVCIVKF